MKNSILIILICIIVIVNAHILPVIENIGENCQFTGESVKEIPNIRSIQECVNVCVKRYKEKQDCYAVTLEKNPSYNCYMYNFPGREIAEAITNFETSCGVLVVSAPITLPTAVNATTIGSTYIVVFLFIKARDL